MRDCGFLGVHIFAAYDNRKASVRAQWDGPDFSLITCKGIAHMISALTQKHPCADLPVSYRRIGGTLDLKSGKLSCVISISGWVFSSIKEPHIIFGI